MASLRILLLLLAFPALAQAVDLNGRWHGDDGGDYYLVQRGGKLSWYAERGATKPVWSNIFTGSLKGKRIRGDWTDVPKGKTRSHGRLELEIRESGDVLVITKKTGGYGGSRLTRASDQPASSRPMAPAPVRPSMSAAKPMPVIPMVKEDCVGFNWKTTVRKQVNGHWKIVDGNHWLFDFGGNAKESSEALQIIKRYRMTNSCFVGRPNPSLSYLLSGEKAPVGAMQGEDCIGFNPDTITVEQHGGRWKVADGSHWLFDFGGNQAEARQALAVIKKHGFRNSCFVGRPDPSFTYLRK